ncbi:MAG: hypothetical protein AAB214_15510, partial [Fibrobacterota bacterium]
MRRAFGVAPGMARVWGCLQVATGFLPLGLLLASRRALAVLETGAGRSELVAAFAMLGSVLLAAPVLSTSLQWMRRRFADRVQQSLVESMHHQACHVPYSFFDRADSHDLVHHVRVNTLSQPFNLLEQTGLALQNLILLGGVLGVLGGYAWWLPALLMGTALPGLVVVAKFNVESVRFNRATTPLLRKGAYLSWLMGEKWFAAEIRMFLLSKLFGGMYSRTREDYRREEMRMNNKEWRIELGYSAAGVVGFLVGIWWLLELRMAGAILVSDLVIAFHAFLMGQKLFRGALDNAGQLYRAGAFLKDFRSFLRHPADPPVNPNAHPFEPLREGIEFQGVRFRYPKAARDCLDG